MKSSDLEGLFPALVTPVEGDEVNGICLKKLTRFVLDNGGDGVLVLGGTGEYTALSKKQRTDAIETVVKEAGNKPVIVGILAPGFEDAVEMGKISEEIGAEAVMLLTPYYVHPTQEGIIKYYLEFMKKVKLSVLIYNIPFRTNVNIEPMTVYSLLKQSSQIIGMKECTQNINQASQLMELTKDRMTFLCGEEQYLFVELVMGAKGAILATACIFPQIWKDMMLSVKTGNINRAREISFKINPLVRLVFSEMNPGPLKVAMKFAGIDVGPVLKPLLSPNAQLVDQLHNTVDEIKEWYSNF